MAFYPGTAGDDDLRGTAANDTFSGGTGNDTYTYNLTISNGRVTATDGFDIIDNADPGGTGFDRLVVNGLSDDLHLYGYTSGLDQVFSFQIGTEWDDPPPDAPAGSITLKNFYAPDASSKVDRIDFTGLFYALVSYDDITGILRLEIRAPGSDALEETDLASLKSNATLIGDATDNFISPGNGNDMVDGRAGVDTVDYRMSLASTGADINLLTGRATDPTGGIDTLVSIENADGTERADRITGDNGVNFLRGWGGDDVLEGGAGDDTLDGGAGNDTASYASASGSVRANVGAAFIGASGYAPNVPSVGLSAGGSAGAAGNDTFRAFYIENLTGSAFDDQLAGDARANVLNGGAGNDLLLGQAGNDTLIGGTGADQIYGDAGLDVAVFASPRAAATLGKVPGALRVTSATDGDDTVHDVERLKFSDGALAFDLNGAAGTAARILGALFGKSFLTNTDYAGIGLSLLDGGTGYGDLIGLALGTDAFKGLAGAGTGAVTNTQFVNLVYKNVVGSAPGASDLAYFTGLLDNGTYTQATLARMACDLDLTANLVNLAGLADTGLAYTPQG